LTKTAAGPGVLSDAAIGTRLDRRSLCTLAVTENPAAGRVWTILGIANLVVVNKSGRQLARKVGRMHIDLLSLAIGFGVGAVVGILGIMALKN
jgi:hypothetical protein